MIQSPEDLLDHALEPALSDHCERLNALNDNAAAEAFFDFRVADISMGSAHFLVAAVDRIERKFTDYIAKPPLSGVRAELQRLRLAAEAALGLAAETVEIEDTQLFKGHPRTFRGTNRAAGDPITAGPRRRNDSPNGLGAAMKTVRRKNVFLQRDAKFSEHNEKAKQIKTKKEKYQ